MAMNFIPTLRNANSAYHLLGVPAIAFCTLLSLSTGLAAGQTSGVGTIAGTVTDSAGALVPGASITVTNVATNVTLSSQSNSKGYFEVNSLNAGTYTITITVPGLKRLVRQGITLQTGATLNVPLQMQVGDVTENVTVTADAPLLNTESGSTGQVLTTKQIESLPVTGANPAWFIQLAPGVQAPYSQTASTDGTLNWNGPSNFGVAGNVGKNEYSLDGAPNMENRANAVNPTEDELGEMKIDITGFDASIGHTLGGAITQTTKSGTNSIHGTFRENYQNKRWSAMNHFQGLNYKYQEVKSGCNFSHSSPTCLALMNSAGWPGTHENDAAFSIGGPVVIPRIFNGRDKLFFFASVHEDVFTGTGSQNISIPTIQERTGDFSDLPQQTTGIPASFTAACPATPYFGQYQIYDPYSVTVDANGIPRRTPICGNVIPANRLANNKMTTFYNSLLPSPTQNSPTGGNFQYTTASPQTYRTYTGRVDWAVREPDHVFFRYTRANYVSQGLGAFPINNIGTQAGPRWIDVAAIGWNHVFSARTNFDFTVGGTNFKTQCCYYPGYQKYTPSDLGLPGYTDDYAATNPALPIITIPNAYQQIGQNNNVATTFRTLAFRGNLTMVRGNHTIRAGGEFRFQNQSTPAQGNANGTYTFDDTYTQQNNGSDATYAQSNVGLGYASFLMGVQTSSSVAYQAPLADSTPYFALYGGDTWRVTPRLTLIPGLRFEWEAGPLEKHNAQIVGWDPNATLPIAGPANAAYQSARQAATPAQQAVLPASLTIQGGPIYAGVNGAPTRQFGNNYRFLPRIAFAYQVRSNTVIRGGYGLFFDTENALYATLDQDGFSASTTVNSSTNYGQNFTPGTPPINDPFPASTGSGHFNQPIGSAAGAMYYLGASPTNVFDQAFVPAREHRGYLGFQHQFGASTMLEVAWLGALTTNISLKEPETGVPAAFYTAGTQPNSASNVLLTSTITNPFNINNFSSLASSNAAAYGLISRSPYYMSNIISLANLVRPYPQMGGLQINRSIGESKFQQLQINGNRRFSKGITFNASLQLNHQIDRDYYANNFDRSPSWEGSNNSVPARFTAESVYSLPFGRGSAWLNSGWKAVAFGGFQLSASYEAQTGQLISFGNLFYVGDIHASNIKIKKPIYVNGQASGGSNYVQWLNPGNVVATASTNSTTGVTTCSYTGTGFVTNPQCQPNGYNLRSFPTRISGVRQLGFNGVNANVQKAWPLVKERISLETRMEVYNLFNHMGLGTPNTTVTSNQFGWVTSDGFPNQNGRWINISGRVRF